MAVITELSPSSANLSFIFSRLISLRLFWLDGWTAGGDRDRILSSINPSIHFFQDTVRFGVVVVGVVGVLNKNPGEDGLTIELSAGILELPICSQARQEDE